MRIFAMGDIHGAHKALVQCLERSDFDKEKDVLIQLGDIVDGWSEVYECVEELLKIKNLICIKGNHDEWFHQFHVMGTHPCAWLQGGDGTLDSYCRNAERDIPIVARMGGFTSSLTNADIPKSHIELFNRQKLYHIDHKNRMFVHGGFDRTQYIDYLEHADPVDFYWNRSLWNEAKSCRDDEKLKTANEFYEIFIGHTATEREDKTCKPMYFNGVWNLDQGAGWSGKLTIMNVDTKEYWQSDNVQELYKDEKGRT